MGLIFVILFQLLKYYNYAIIIYILMSWFPGARESAVGRFLETIVEPYLEPFRRVIPPLGMFDISPLIAIMALQFAGYGLSTVASFFI